MDEVVRAFLENEQKLRLVKRLGRGGFQVKSLEEALKRSGSGDVIRLPAGVYRLSQPLEIGKSVTLVGDGMEKTRVLCDGEGYVIKVSGGKFSARGISFEHLGQKWANAMVIDSAAVAIENCRFRGGVLDLENERGGGGLWIRGDTTGVVKASVFVQNKAFGIHVTDLAEVVLEGNTCEDNKQCGIAYFGNTRGTARNNVCLGNGQAQIWVAKTAKPDLYNNAGEVKREPAEWSGCATAAAYLVASVLMVIAAILFQHFLD